MDVINGPKVVHRVDIHLAPEEYGNEKMREAADEVFADETYRTYAPLLVVVYEHAGWWLAWAVTRGGILVVGTANDRAVLTEPAQEWLREHGQLPQEQLDTIRREPNANGITPAAAAL